MFAGLLKILPVFIMVLPGVIGYVLYRDVIGNDVNLTLPVLIDRLAPSGFKGLILAGLLAALMSTVASGLNSCATLVAVDIVGRIRPGKSAQVRIGRVAAIVVLLLAMFRSNFGGRYNSIFEGINAIASELAPPITTVFVWGVFWRRGNSSGVPGNAHSRFPARRTSFCSGSAGHRKGGAFCLCSLVFVGVSLATPAPSAAQLIPVAWDGPPAALDPGAGRSRLYAGLLLITIAELYWLFR